MSSHDTIHTRAMLVKLSISCWDGRRFDEKITREVTTKHSAQAGAGRFNKHLLGGKDAAPSHAKAIRANGSARKTFYQETLPWADEGWRLLPTKNYEQFTDAIRERKAEFDTAVAAFLRDYPKLCEAAKHLLGDMYREADYPDVEAIKEKFAFRVEFSPVPRAGDFRLELPQEQLAEIEENTAERVRGATRSAMADAWGRLRETLERVREKLSDPDKVFRDSLIGNVAEVSKVLTRLNITDDPKLEEMRKLVQGEIATLDPSFLRKSPDARRAAADSADALLDRMKGMYGGTE